MDFYDDVLRELVFAVGAALFLGNLLALVRRRAPARANGASAPGAPVIRTVVFMVLGLFVAVWGLASIVSR